MGLMNELRRLRYVWGWRVRYWWLDTNQGRLSQWIACGISAAIVLIQFARMLARAF